ncbi:MAG: isocitrate lyase/phosphoenolpyruvate mutase family protein [Chloroflexota bacterium]
MTTQLEKANRLKGLHESGVFVIPNPWDVGSAKIMEGLGFQALATTSSGFAYTLGRLDGQVTFEEKLDHCRALAAATSVPISADLENMFAHDPESVAKKLKLAAETGIVGGSIEDYDGEKIYDFNHAVERVQAAVEAAKSLDFPFGLTARSENLIRNVIDLDDTIRRLQAFEAAGASVLYAPGLKTLEDVKLVVESVSKPVNVLISTMADRATTVEQLVETGARRISVGGAMAHIAYGSLIRDGDETLEHGSFNWLNHLSTGRKIGSLLG